MRGCGFSGLFFPFFVKNAHFCTMIRVFLLALASLFVLNSCSKSSAEIESEVRDLWMQNLQKEQVKGVNVLDVSLVQKSDSLYTGVLKTKEPEGTFLYNLEVTLAGNTLSYEVIGDGIPTDGRNTHEPDDQPVVEDSIR
jgi:protein involved in sex pheromone biosynthesis